MTEGRSWQVELKGKGEHVALVRLLVPVRSMVDGKRFDLAIPAVASTQVDLGMPDNALGVTAGNDDVLPMASTPGTPGVRLGARLSPRSSLAISWREKADPAARVPPLLTARGDIAIEIEPGSVKSKTSWIVGAIRGSVDQLTLRLDPAEDVLDVEVDGRPIPVEARRDGGRTVLTIPLVEPIRPGVTRIVTLNTRRPIASTGTVRLMIQGVSIDQARVQSGMVAISRVGPIYLNATAGRGLRRIDPRTQLPDSLRNRADTVLGFEYDDQPFELGLGVEPSPPPAARRVADHDRGRPPIRPGLDPAQVSTGAREGLPGAGRRARRPGIRGRRARRGRRVEAGRPRRPEGHARGRG